MERAGQLEALAPFIGEWTMQVAFPGGESTGNVGLMTVEWTLDGRFLLQRSSVDHPEAPDGLSIIATDPTGGQDAYTQHYFDERGVVRLYAMTFRDGEWVLLRTEPDFTPLNFCQRYVGTFADDGSEIRGRWETSADGTAWELDFELAYIRIG